MNMNGFFEENFCITQIKHIGRFRDEISTTTHLNRSFHGLVLFTKGESKYDFTDGNSYLIKENQVIYLPKYSNYYSSDAKNTECIAIDFEIEDKECTFPTFFLNQALGEKYLQKFNKILHLWSEQRSGYLNGCLSVLYDIIFHIQQDAKRKYLSSEQSRLVEEASLYIHVHLTEQTLSVEQVSREFNITPEYFRRLFHSVKGISPIEYIISQRIETAKRMIASGEIKLRYVADECGFNDYPYFSRVFKKRTGMSPLHYSKK